MVFRPKQAKPAYFLKKLADFLRKKSGHTVDNAVQNLLEQVHRKNPFMKRTKWKHIFFHPQARSSRVV